MSQSYERLFEEEGDDHQIPMQMGFINNIPPFPANLTLPPLGYYNHHHQPLKTPSYSSLSPANFSETLLGTNTTTALQKPPQDLTASLGGGEGSQLLSLNRSSRGELDSWAWGEGSSCLTTKKGKRSGGDDHNHNLGVASSSSIKMKKIIMKGRRKVREPRFCFKTMSDVDVLDDGYKWRKYGQKVVKNTHHPRSYYRCTQDNCRVKKRVERLAEDPRMVITTYEGRHAHSPSNELEDSQNPSELCDFLW